ncbi:hypothetical protein E8E11_008255 [Didymella keratinophila]|nr:hypothetical protein E8E11_008255 [Didymella keratinophila]
MAAFAPPVQRDKFLYGSVLYAEAGNNNRHPRASVAELTALLRPEAPQSKEAKTSTASHSSTDPPWHFWTAQLIHYGLTPTKDKNAAKIRLLSALNGGKLEVPGWIIRLETEVKNEWEAENKKLKKSTKGAGAPRTPAKRKAVTTQSSPLNISVKIEMSQCTPGKASQTAPATPKSTATKRKRDLSEPSSTATPAKKSKPRVKKEQAVEVERQSPASTAGPGPGDIILSGTYDIDIDWIMHPVFDAYIDGPFQLDVFMDGTTGIWWAKFNWAMLDGIIKMDPGPTYETATNFHTLGWRIRNVDTEAPDQNTAASRNRFGPDLLAPTAVNNWVPESHPVGGTEAHTTREDSIKKERDGLRRAIARVCETGHVVLVIWWSPSNPLNRKGTWSLEIFDCRFELWGEFGIEAHEQCELNAENDMVNALSKAMIKEWKTVLSTNKEHTNPVCEWNKDKRKLQDDKYNERSLPALREMERELRPLVVCALGRVPRGQSNGTPDDKGDQDKNDEEIQGNKNDQILTKEELIAKRKAAQRKVNLANLAAKMGDQAQRTAESRKRVEASEKLRRDAQRSGNGTQAVYDSDSRSFVSRSSILGTSPLDMADEVGDVRPVPSRTKKVETKRKSGVGKATKTEEEDADLRRIWAAARKEQEEQEEEEREDKERQCDMAAPQEGTDFEEQAGHAATQEQDSNEDLTAALLEGLDNASREPGSSQTRPTKKAQEEAKDSESTTESTADKPKSKERKRMLKPRAPITQVTPDSSDIDSVRPPQPSTPVKAKPKANSKAKPATSKATSKTKKTKVAKETRLNGAKSAKTKEAKASKGKENNKYKSEEVVADSDLENDEIEGVKLSSDKLQSEEVSVEITEASAITVRNEHDGYVVEEFVETATVAVEVQQRDGSVRRTEVTETTTARSDFSEDRETTVKHTTHVETVIQLEVPHQDMPHDSRPSSPERDLQDGFNTPTNALGIEVPITPPPPSPTRSDSSSPLRKCKSPSPDEEPQFNQVTKIDEEHGLPSTPASPSSSKKRKITLPTSHSTEEGAAAAEASKSPCADDALSPENAASPDTATPSPGPAPDDVNTSIEPTPTRAEATAAAFQDDAPFSPKPATHSPPISPAGSIRSSTFSSSSKKRMATWSEEDGEVTTSPRGTKRAKRTQSSGMMVTEETKREENVDGEGETEFSQQAHTEIVVGLEDDGESFDSLFDESSQKKDQCNA